MRQYQALQRMAIKFRNYQRLFNGEIYSGSRVNINFFEHIDTLLLPTPLYSFLSTHQIPKNPSAFGFIVLGSPWRCSLSIETY
jgi:hypothetical protein